MADEKKTLGDFTGWKSISEYPLKDTSHLKPGALTHFKRMTIVLEPEDGSKAAVIVVEKDADHELFIPLSLSRGFTMKDGEYKPTGEQDVEICAYKRKKT